MSEVGLIITGEDKATAMMESIGRAGKASLEGIRGAASKAGDAFKMMGKATVVFNQALELGKKAVEVFRMVVVDNVRAMIEYRGEADSVAKKFKEIADEAAYTRAVIADLLTPVIFGLADAWKETGSALVDYINTNRRLIATNITEFLADTADILINGIAVGVTWVSRAYSGWLEIIYLVSGASEKFFSALSLATTGQLGLMSMFADAVGSDMAEPLARAAEDARKLGDVFDESGDKHLASVEEQVRKQEELEASIKKVRDVALTFTGEARASMLRWADSWEGVTRNADDTSEAMNRLIAKANLMASLDARIAAGKEEIHIANLTRIAELEEKEATRIARQTDMFKQYSAAAGTAFGEIIANQEDAAASGKKLAISAMQATLVTASSEAAAKAIAAHSGIPFIGVAIGLSFAAAAVAAIMSYATTQFATGGVFRSSGGSGQATLHDKERVLDVRQTQTFDHLVYDVLPRLIGARTAGAGAGGVQVNNWDMRSFIPRRGVEMQRAVLEVNKTQKKLQRRGRIKR